MTHEQYEFLNSVQQDVMKRVAYANPTCILGPMGPDELIILHHGGEFGDSHRTEIGFSDDELIGTKAIVVNRYIDDKLAFHQFIITEDPTHPEEVTPYGITSVNTDFNGDADCDIMSTLYSHIPGMSWRRVEDRTVSLCEKLDRVIRQAQQPSFEEAIHRILDEILEEGPGKWDDDEDKDV